MDRLGFRVRFLRKLLCFEVGLKFKRLKLENLFFVGIQNVVELDTSDSLIGVHGKHGRNNLFKFLIVLHVFKGFEDFSKGNFVKPFHIIVQEGVVSQKYRIKHCESDRKTLSHLFVICCSLLPSLDIIDSLRGFNQIKIYVCN